MKLNGSQMIIEALHAEGVDVIFGYPGGAVLNIYDEICKQNYFKHILTRHEQAAVHAADGYARATGKVGVAFVTSGPGFTNAVTGIATAYTDSIPMVVISGQVPISLIGTDAFQEIDAVGISRPCTKHNYLVKTIEELPHILQEAFYIARSGRPGPVHIDVPKDITATIGEFYRKENFSMQTYKPVQKGNPKQIQKALEVMKEATKPILYIGGGVILAEAVSELRELTSLTGIPCVETLMARGSLAHDDENLIGMLGMHGTYAANMGMSEADLIISLGARFDDRVTGKLSEFAKNAQVIHVDVDPSSISKLVNAHYPIVGDLKLVLKELNEQLRKDGFNKEGLKHWRELIKRFDELHPLDKTYSEDGKALKPQTVIKKMGELLPKDAVVATDVGQHQMWTAQFFPFNQPRQFVTSGGLGTMGFGFPAAMGAKVGCKDKVVVNITGDGSIQMNSQEMMTATEQGLNVINVILNNNYLGMVRQWQTLFYEKRYSAVDLSSQPDFVKLAEAYGAKGYRVESYEDFEKAFKEAMTLNVPVFIDVVIDRMENVLPMVPTGGTLYNMLLEFKD
ncbi:MAG: acetolactate synthase large subunit [Campylobacterales bacterium]|nr:acetolactate synthase large subunit [Campylobacterales bacterium]